MAPEGGTVSAGPSVTLPPRQVPALDGFRALSILLVVASHAGLDRVVPGGLGVTVFFVVSGFLIGWQLSAEAERTGGVDLRGFYLRRVFRLVPALAAYCALCVVVLLLLGQPVPGARLAAALLYVSNYLVIFGTGAADDPFAITWSLAIEEHFYLVFPFLVLLCARRPGRLLPLGLLAMAAALAWRTVLVRACGGPVTPPWSLCGVDMAHGVAGIQRIYYATDTRFDAMAAGVAAVVAARRRLLPRWLFGRATLPAAGLLLLGTLLARDPAYRDTLRYTLQELCIAAMLLAVSFGPDTALNRVLASRPLVGLGRLSYSLYLYHWGVALLLAGAVGPVGVERPALLAAYLVASLLLAAGSFRFVEQPFLRLRRRFGSHAPSGLAT